MGLTIFLTTITVVVSVIAIVMCLVSSYRLIKVSRQMIKAKRTKKTPEVKLKVAKELVFNVEYDALEEFIRHHSGRDDYNILACEGWGNDSHHHFYVDGNVTSFGTRDYHEFCNGVCDGSYKLHTILNVLASEGKIEKGSYLVNVCW